MAGIPPTPELLLQIGHLEQVANMAKDFVLMTMIAYEEDPPNHEALHPYMPQLTQKIAFCNQILHDPFWFNMGADNPLYIYKDVTLKMMAGVHSLYPMILNPAPGNQ
ncbi:Oidioi.mRNA.OKI2018_I69.chr1.g2757.t1.cds [Oikopleura dioica]|uniref:Oidioi.mRNA.OKI2018_I69.chr1.g2757.t1.cds n=1 Tax=Oikopleura dioica TaxID=34765 RepID=A0ABN7SSN9_OIKDI|nr:Oidioi.mRNA.OKI2018_I69.chr1.g2757.t1.cds [Oikopleura dioica]